VAYFNILRQPMALLPSTISTLISARVALTRIENFLTSSEISHDEYKSEASVGNNSNNSSLVAISIENGDFSWMASRSEEGDQTTTTALNSNNRLTLTNVNLQINRGELVMVIGSIGSGKSSLLSAILGEITKLNGTVSDNEGYVRHHFPISYLAASIGDDTWEIERVLRTTSLDSECDSAGQRVVWFCIR